MRPAGFSAYPSLPTGPPPPSSGPPPSASYAPYGASPWGQQAAGSSAAPGPMAASRPAAPGSAQQQTAPSQPQPSQQPQQQPWGAQAPPPPPALLTPPPGAAAAQQPPSMGVPFNNGPPPPLLGGGGLSSMGSDSVSLIRLRLDDFRIDPPIPVSVALLESAAGNHAAGSGGSYPDLQAAQQQQQQQQQRPGAAASGGGGGAAAPVPSLEVERRLVAEGEGGARPDPVAEFFGKADAGVWQSHPGVAPFVDMGYKHVHAALGVAFTKEYKLSDGDVPDFASNLSELQSLGYPLATSAGALALRGNDLRAATELCLSLPPAS